MLRFAFLLISFIHLPLHAAPLNWQSCEEDPFYLWATDAPDMQCAMLDVPLAYHPDHRRARLNDTRTITLALSKIPASGERIGSLVFIGGGPGQSGIQPAIYDNDAFATLRQHFDIISYDPRGVGLSTPRIECHDYGERLIEDPREFIAACQARTAPELLPHIGSDEAVNDLDRIRKALGGDTISLVSYSYGSKIAALYALRFPEHVRAIVLDGIVDLFESSYAIRLHQEKSYQRTFERYLEQCTRIPFCPFAAGQSGSATLLPLMAWRATLSERPLPWTQQLYNHFATQWELDPKTRHIPEEYDILGALYSHLMWPEYWPVLSSALLEFAQGEAEYLEYLSWRYEEFADDALIAINCADMARPMRDGENLIFQRHIDLQSPYDNYRFFPRHEMLDPCGLWPYPGGDYRQALPAATPEQLPPLLFIAQRHDPATPWHNARRMADYFQSPLLTREQDGHTLVFTDISPCVNAQASDYLLHPRKSRPDSTCND